MSLLLIPIKSPGTAQTVRGLSWTERNLAPQMATIVQRSYSGRSLRIPKWQNPLWKWNFVWDYIKDKDVQAGNSPYTDLQVLMGFFLKVQGAGQEFAYQPPDTTQTSVVLAAPDASGFVELTHDIGGFKESVTELNGTSVTNVKKNGIAAGFVLNTPGTIAPYEGYVLNSSGTAWVNTDVITASYTLFYRCAFTEDSLDFNNFLYKLWQLKSLEFEQVRVP